MQVEEGKEEKERKKQNTGIIEIGDVVYKVCDGGGVRENGERRRKTSCTREEWK